jgi:hypothetical protein
MMNYTIPTHKKKDDQESHPQRTLLQDILISILLGFLIGLLVGIGAGIAGLVAYRLEWSPWISPVLTIVGSIWILNHQMVKRLKRVYRDHKVTSTEDHKTFGTMLATALTAGYIYALSSVEGLIGSIALSVPMDIALYWTLCGPLAIMQLIYTNLNLSPMMPWLVVGGWLIARAWLYHPTPSDPSAAQEER